MKKKYRNFIKLVLVVLFFILFVGPIVLLAIKSVAFGWHWPTDFNIRAWKIILQDPTIMKALKTTMEIALAVVILNILLGLSAAKTLSRFEFKGKSVIETVLFMPILVPVLAVTMGIHITMIKLGLADHLVGVILIHLLPTLPYSIRILKAGFDRFGIKWEEQAKSLGACPTTVFFTITLPLMIPSIRSAALLSFVISISQYVLTAIIGGGRVMTLSLIYFPYFNSADEAIIASFSIVFALLPIIFLLFMEACIRSYLYSIRKL